MSLGNDLDQIGFYLPSSSTAVSDPAAVVPQDEMRIDAGHHLPKDFEDLYKTTLLISLVVRICYFVVIDLIN
jgi:hypothetical protein